MECVFLQSEGKKGFFSLPVNKWGNFIGKMTASFKASLAASRPAISDQRTFGFSLKIAPIDIRKDPECKEANPPNPCEAFSFRHLRYRLRRLSLPSFLYEVH
jgi:hypothetical protein